MFIASIILLSFVDAINNYHLNEKQLQLIEGTPEITAQVTPFHEDNLAHSPVTVRYWNQEGHDVSDINIFENKKLSRSITTSTRWSVIDADGKIAIPFSFHATFPVADQAKVVEVMARMNSDIGCLKTIYIHPLDVLDITSFGRALIVIYFRFTMHFVEKFIVEL